MSVQFATFCKSVNSRNTEKSVSDILNWFPHEISFCIFVTGCKLTIMLDIQPANLRVINSAVYERFNENFDVNRCEFISM